MAKNVVFDVDRMPITEDGVTNFSWPLSRPELLSVRDRFIGALVPFLRREAKSDKQAAVLGLMIYFHSELLGHYRAHAVMRRLEQHGIIPILPPKSRLFQAMWQKRTPTPSPLIESLERGIACVPPWRRTARQIKDLLGSGPIRNRSITQLDPRMDIVTVATGDMILQHASALDEPINYVRLEEWFGPLSSSDRAEYGGRPRKALIGAVLDLARDAFAAGNEAVPDYCALSFENWLSSVGTLADRYITRLLKEPNRIPRRLWRGTGGHVWGRLLSFVARELGGHVTGHDHAHGSNMFTTYSDTIVEHPGCDRFMVWTNMQKMLTERNIRHDLLMQDEPPKISVVPGHFKPKILESFDGVPRRISGRPTVMYVGTLYNDEMAPFTPLVPSIVLVDWEARLIAGLRSLGYNVIVKPHPESLFSPPASYQDVLGAQIIGGRFEDVYQEADVILFGQSNSTSFFGAVGTRRPIVIADTGIHEWQQETLQLVSHRAAVVRGRYDSENRIHHDWTALKSALESAPSLMSTRFYEEFFVGSGEIAAPSENESRMARGISM